MLGLFVFMAFFVGETHAETFEFLTFTPPRTWTNQTVSEGVAYRRPNGIGLIYFYPSYPAAGSPVDEFAKMWRARVEPTLPGAAPRPQTQREGDYTVAAGSKTVDAQGTLTNVALAVVVGRGRAIGVLTMAAGEEALGEVTAFLNTVNVLPAAQGPALSRTTQPAPSRSISVCLRAIPRNATARPWC
jgi:hypothetical protein